MDLQDLTLQIEQHIEVGAAVGTVYEGMLKRLAEGNTTPNEQPMPMVLERSPGGRWFRDLGNGTGHLWAFVQVIKPPTLLELHGPLFMSYPVASHVAMRLTQIAGGTRLSLRHRALGLIDDEHRKGVTAGWTYMLEKIKHECE